jgi:C4-dicarboxylate transporter, DctM subunit
LRWLPALLLPMAGAALGAQFDGQMLPLWPAVLAVLALLLAGAPIFAALGGLALALFWGDGLPLASVPLSHYQITVNPSLPALPLFTLAGLLLARTGAAQRLGAVFLALFGGGVRGTVLAVAVLCSGFTALTGGSGVTILALGGLLLPMLLKAGYPEQRGIGLVTSASALGVLLAPSVPLIMYAVMARVPIQDMFLAGLVPALVMVACLLLVGGYLRRGPAAADLPPPSAPNLRQALSAAWVAKWELAAPLVALGALGSGLATPTESAALTAAYAMLTQALAHRELGWRLLGKTLSDCAQIIGGVMLILGMALALTNFMVDAGIPDLAVEWVQGVIPNKFVFLLVLCLFLFAAAALMEIYAAIVVLVPLLLPLAMAYGIDPVHFGIIFLAAMEVGFLCPPAGMNIYFAAAMFGKSIGYVARSVLPAMAAIFLGTLIIALLPGLATGLPNWVAGRP